MLDDTEKQVLVKLKVRNEATTRKGFEEGGSTGLGRDLSFSNQFTATRHKHDT